MQCFTEENETMHAVEIETTIDSSGNIHLPERYRQIYGKAARLLVLIPEGANEQPIDPMQFSATVPWPVEGMAYQQQVRAEWD
jgi:hypothetical protein